MPLRAVCDACEATGPLLLYPHSDRIKLPDGWASSPSTVGPLDHEAVPMLLACGERCLVRLHDARASVSNRLPKGKR